MSSKFDNFLLFLVIILFSNTVNAQEDFVSLFTKEKSGPLGLVEGAGQDQLRASTLRVSKGVLKSKRLPSNLRLHLFEDTVIDISLDDSEVSSYNDMLVYRGRSSKGLYKHLDHYRDIVIIVNPKTQEFTAQLHLKDGNFQITPMAGEGIYHVIETSTEAFECHSDELTGTYTAKQSNLKNGETGCEERDSNGKYVADLFVGYSYAAAARVIDLDAHALSLVEMVNNGLSNSLIDDIYVRLVGTGLNPENPGVVTSVLGDVNTWYEDEIAATGADYVASIQVPTGGQSEAGGWAGVGGYSSVNSVNSAAAVFRHEIGHNVGSSHCNPGIQPYAAGYNNGQSKTHMCGNNVNFYSNPLVMDEHNLPLGDSATADNARLWSERAPIVSARRAHTIKYDANDTGCDPTSIANGRYHIINVNSGMYLSTYNESNSRGAKVTQSDLPELSNEWDLLNIGANRFEIGHVASGRNVDVPGSSSGSDTHMTIWTKHSGKNQIFNFIEVSKDTFEIRAFNGLCVQIRDSGIAIGDTIVQNACDNTNNTKWILAPVSGGPDLAVEITTTDVACFGAENGSATAIATGGSGTYTYAWSTAETTASISGLSPGSYSVSISDGERMVPSTFQIKQEPALVVTSSFVAGDINLPGQASVTVSNGIAPISYSWSSGEITSTATNLVTGLNNVIISDGGGCSITKEIYVPCDAIYRPCDDGNPETQGDHINEECNCIGEVVASSDDLLLSNVALDKPTLQSGLQSGGLSSRAVDGNPDGRYSNLSVIRTGKDTNSWWEVDLEAVYDVNNIVIWNRTDCCYRNLDGFYVFTSETSFDTTDLQMTIDDPAVQNQLFSDAPLSNLLVTPEGPFRYLRIQLDGEDDLMLAEVEIFVCGEVVSDIIAVNPLSDQSWEVKGNIKRKGREISSVVLEYGKDVFSNSVEVNIEGINEVGFYNITNVININPDAVKQQFRFKILADGLYYYSDSFEITVGQSYCIPESENGFWYKRFSKVVHNEISYSDNGNINYEDQTAFHFGEFKMDSSYVFEMSTPSSGWTNLYYIIYIDLNNDGDFEDYNEKVGTSDPIGQVTSVSIAIPYQDVILETNLRMRILGHEGGEVNACNTPIGNYKDFSLTIVGAACKGTGHITMQYTDSDGDGYGDAGTAVLANCNDKFYSMDNTDFNDDERFAYPGAPEICDGIDNNGNITIDEGASLGEPLLVLQSQTLVTGGYTAAETIKSSNGIIVDANADVRFFAGQSVEIGPSFEIPTTTDFFVIIKDDCSVSARSDGSQK